MPITLRNLSKSFDGKPVLNSLSHTFPDDCVTCIVGPSGCGKTTLLNLLLGLLTPDSGEITGLPRTIAAVFQEDRLLEHCTVLGNLRAVLHLPESELFSALEQAGLGDVARQPLRTLSGGMKRRVAILRALLADSELLVMDEPFKALDAETRRRMLDLIRPRIVGKTVLIVTHSPDEAALLNASVLSLEPQKTPD